MRTLALTCLLAFPLPALAQDAVLIGGDGLYSPGFVKIADGAATGAYVLTPFVDDPARPAVAAFSKRYRQAFSGSPDAWAALSYDALGTLADALNAALGAGPLTRESVREGLASMKSLETGSRGLTGTTWFDKQGDCLKPPVIAYVTSRGRFTIGSLQLQAIDNGSPPSPAPKAVLAGDPVFIAVASPFTGQLQRYGQSIRQGVALKLDEINASGGIAGRPLEVIWADDEATPRVARRVAQGLVANPKVLAVLGHFTSSCTLAGKPVYKQGGLVALTAGATNVAVCEGSKWMFRSLYNDVQMGYAIADFMKHELKKRSVAILFDNDDYGTFLKDSFTVRARKLGLKVIATIEYNRESTTEFAPLVARARSAEVVLVAGLYTEGGLIAKECRAAGLTR
jgi:ABC-type branched-subunit amino acid transport system substrate-binding protein